MVLALAQGFLTITLPLDEAWQLIYILCLKKIVHDKYAHAA